jgi:CubicO group peptidase (beta-lactamase class C family)
MPCGRRTSHDLMRRDAALPMVSYLEKIFDLGSKWLYMNWGYAVTDEVIEKLSGKS